MCTIAKQTRQISYFEFKPFEADGISDSRNDQRSERNKQQSVRKLSVVLEEQQRIRVREYKHIEVWRKSCQEAT